MALQGIVAGSLRTRSLKRANLAKSLPPALGRSAESRWRIIESRESALATQSSVMNVWHYSESGAGRPLILLHGIGMSHAAWNAVTPHLCATRRVIAFDIAGFGLTLPLAKETVPNIPNLVTVLRGRSVRLVFRPRLTSPATLWVAPWHWRQPGARSPGVRSLSPRPVCGEKTRHATSDTCSQLCDLWRNDFLAF